MSTRSSYLVTIKPLAITLVVAGIVALGFFSSFTALTPLPPLVGHNITCESSLSENKDELDVYVTEATISQLIITRLCQDPVIKRQFGNVRAIVGQSDFDTYRYINHGVADLALIKSNVVEAFDANQTYGYEAIASHPDYTAYFIAMREKPALTKEYLLGKRIGLLDYPSSRSGHIVPKTLIAQLGLSESNVSIQYYNTHQELREALITGEVDIISSYWGKGDGEILSPNYITPLNDKVTGMRWYLKMQTRNTDLRCALQQAIKDIASEHPRKYYQSVELISECDNDQA